MADPWCGRDVSPDVTPSLFAPAPRLANPAQLARIRSDLPILIAPATLTRWPQAESCWSNWGQDADVADVTVKLYPAARHDILNETNRRR